LALFPSHRDKKKEADNSFSCCCGSSHVTTGCDKVIICQKETMYLLLLFIIYRIE
jgi:hypothetical protein